MPLTQRKKTSYQSTGVFRAGGTARYIRGEPEDISYDRPWLGMIHARPRAGIKTAAASSPATALLRVV